MHEWKIKIRCWPYSGTRQEDIGPEIQGFNIPNVDSFSGAVRFADAFLMGIKCNPKVWEAHIISVEMIK